jgi:hypothetical protein
MTPHDLQNHKKAPKKLEKIPVFKPQARHKLPKPFKKLGGPRIESTGMMNVSADHVAFMFWKDGEIFTDRAFFAYLFCRLENNGLSPIFEFHWHPNHKGFHCKTPCRTEQNYANRTLPGAPELALKTNRKLDPKNHNDRLQLITRFCEWCGISLPDKDENSEVLF